MSEHELNCYLMTSGKLYRNEKMGISERAIEVLFGIDERLREMQLQYEMSEWGRKYCQSQRHAHTQLPFTMHTS